MHFIATITASMQKAMSTGMLHGALCFCRKCSHTLSRRKGAPDSSHGPAVVKSPMAGEGWGWWRPVVQCAASAARQPTAWRQPAGGRHAVSHATPSHLPCARAGGLISEQFPSTPLCRNMPLKQPLMRVEAARGRFLRRWPDRRPHTGSYTYNGLFG